MFNWQNLIKNKFTGEQSGLYEKDSWVDHLPDEGKMCYFVPKDTSAITFGMSYKKQFVPRGASHGDKYYDPKEVLMWAYTKEETKNPSNSSAS